MPEIPVELRIKRMRNIGKGTDRRIRRIIPRACPACGHVEYSHPMIWILEFRGSVSLHNTMREAAKAALVA